ncbi:MAG: pilus assembly protein [Acidobacteriia bacterium]|nr:pilus assembly protein [Terriglobia bacterium]
MTHQTHRWRGSATLEMTLVGIPLIFVLISTFEMARGMWIYHTLAYATRAGTRFAVVHGQNCSVAGNNCAVTRATIAGVIQSAGLGLDPGLLKVQMKSLSEDTGLVTLASLLNDSATFPTGAGAVQQAPITVYAQYPFQSAISMFWPGARGGIQFGSFALPASSQERVQF